MARFTIPLLLLSFSILLFFNSVESCHRCSRVRAFMINACRNTRYPKACEQALSSHLTELSTNPSYQELAGIALRVSLTRAKSARAYLTAFASKVKGGRGTKYQALGDCLDQIDDSVAQLRQSLVELQMYSQEGGLDDFMWHMDNIVTWTSSALTDQTTCFEAISNIHQRKRIKAVIKGRVTEVAQATSNALALVNWFITRQRFVRGIHRP